MANLDQYEGNFTIFNNEIWDIAEEFDLSNGAVVLYMKIKSMTYGMKKSIFPSQLYLSRALRCSVRTVQRYLGELVKARCLVSLQRNTTSNLYTLLPIKQKTLSTGTTPVTHKEESKLILNYVCVKRDDDKTLEIIKVLGDNFIDVDSPRGREYLKLSRQEKAKPNQLDFALKMVNDKIIHNKIKKSEFGLAVMSIRQSKLLLNMYPQKKLLEGGKITRGKGYYDKFYS